VSDNSSEDTVSNLLVRNFENLEIRRRGNIPSFLHSQLCLQEASAPLVCLFHDDDILFPNFTDAILALSKRAPEAIAYATNAEVGRTNSRDVRKEFFLKDKAPIIQLKSKSELLKRYFGRFNQGIAPFSSYCYRADKIRENGIVVPNNMGKFADVIFLLDLLDFGEIAWTTEVGIQYNLHGSNDSLTDSVCDRKRLLRHLESLSGQIEDRDLDNYRFAFLKGIKTIALSRGRSPNQLKIINGALCAARLKRFFRFSDYQDYLRRLINQL